MVFGQILAKTARREFSIFITFSDTYTCTYVEFKNFELIPIKFGFLRIFKVAPKSGQSPCTIVQGLEPNFGKNG